MSSITFKDLILGKWQAATGRSGALSTFSSLGINEASRNGDCYAWTSILGASSGDNLIYVQNNSEDSALRIRYLYATASKRVDYSLQFVTGTPAGSIITGKNLNRFKTPIKVADAVSYGNGAVTGLTGDGNISFGSAAVDDHMFMDLEDIVILGFQDAVALDITTTSLPTS